MNYISFISNNLIRCIKLKVLDLEMNNLSNISISILALLSLEEINLKHNKINIELLDKYARNPVFPTIIY